MIAERSVKRGSRFLQDSGPGTAIHKYVLKVVCNEKPLFVDLSAIIPFNNIIIEQNMFTKNGCLASGETYCDVTSHFPE